jgi:hypothetical protein
VQHRVGHAIVVVSAKKDAREGNAEGRTVDRTAVVHKRKYLVRVVLEVLAHGPDYGSLTKVVLVLNSHEQRFEASTREGFQARLRCNAARRHAGLPFCQK